ncbi:MAG: FHA domain-containing protein, partial [Planctomycetota bacterium]
MSGTAAPAKVYLFFLSGVKKGKIESCDAQVIRIGRQPYCEIQLDPYQDIPASGEHAKIVCQPDGTFTLFDAGSSWGTYKNDVRLTGPVAVTTGDVITLGIDDAGNSGPRLKFYLEKDILRCPSCEGPVYKRHFRCPDCQRKTCLRCIDFRHKTCKPCGRARAAGPGYEVVLDSGVQARPPAKVILSGKEAERARRARERQRARAQAPDDPGVIAEPVDLDSPFCVVCCDFVRAEVFLCPSCRQSCCVRHRRGRVCPTCAGLPPAQIRSQAYQAGRGTEPELRIPDLNDLSPAPPGATNPPP